MCGFSINDKRNLVSINYNLHKHLHTDAYHTAVGIIISRAYKKAGVLKAIKLMKSILATASYLV